ncbi:MAG TPA: phage holin family protein [Longimicrobiales bacterium]|nr:phage holin family protein [Longimicrobiales bacterium]
MGFLLRLLVTAASLWVAVQIVPGINYSGHWAGLLGVAFVFGLVNALVRPILYLLTCPLVLITLGLFVLVLNALMLLLTSALSQMIGLGFQVSGFIPAFLGGIVIGITSAVLNIFVNGERKQSER